MTKSKQKTNDKDQEFEAGFALPLIGELTTEQYRQKLAGLIDQDADKNEADIAKLKKLAVDFVAILPEVFGDSLDRLKIWDRISSGLVAANAKATNTDHERFVQLVLDHIKADPAMAGRNENLAAMLGSLETLSVTDRDSWIVLFGSHLVPILVKARVAWNEKKLLRAKTKRKQNVPTKEAK